MSPIVSIEHSQGLCYEYKWGGGGCRVYTVGCGGRVFSGVWCGGCTPVQEVSEVTHFHPPKFRLTRVGM